jgi:hypothetical protein
MSPPSRWAGPAATAGPTSTEREQQTSHGHPHRIASRPWTGPTPSDGRRELFYDGCDDQRLTVTQRFERFHRQNPRVYETPVALAREWIRRTGRRKVGIASLYERCRWDLAMVTNDPNYRLNNDYKAFYARLIMLREADLDGVFGLRESAEADAWIKRVAS